MSTNNVVNRCHAKYLEDRREEWIESRKKMIERFPFLNIVSHMPYPSEVRVWRDELHLDGYIYLFNNEAKQAVHDMNSDPKAVQRDVAEGEEVYFESNIDECPYYLCADGLESFLAAFADDFEKLEEENIELRKRLGEDVSEPRKYPCFKEIFDDMIFPEVE